VSARFLRIVIAAVVLADVADIAGAAATATVDLKTTVADGFLGLGVEWDPYEYPPSEAELKLTLARLDFMQPAFLRVMLHADEHSRPLFAILDYAQSHGIDVMLGEWQTPAGFAGPQDPRWVRSIADFVTYLKTRKKYTVIRYYNFFNEPNGNWMWPGGKVDYDGWAAGMRLLRQALDAHGLRTLPIAGPDNSGDWEWLDRSVRELPKQIGFWEAHWYVTDKELLDGDVERLLRAKRAMPAKGLYMAEAGVIQGRRNGDQQPRVKDFDYGVLMADYVAQIARAGWLGASAWDLDDAMHVVNGRPHPAVPDDLTLKIWGFWNTQGRAMGHPEDEAIRPWFYTWSLMSRLFPKGSRVVNVKESEFPAGLRTVAAVNANGLSAMVVNEADEARAVVVRIPDWPGKKFAQYDYFEGNRPVDRDGFPVAQTKMLVVDRENSVQVELPSRGVVFICSPVMAR
jgi:hypothetical protein